MILVAQAGLLLVLVAKFVLSSPRGHAERSRCLRNCAITLFAFLLHVPFLMFIPIDRDTYGPEMITNLSMGLVAYGIPLFVIAKHLVRRSEGVLKP